MLCCVMLSYVSSDVELRYVYVIVCLIASHVLLSYVVFCYVVLC